MSDKPKDFGVICEHGGLRRKCDSCALIDREVELDAAEAEIARLREALERVTGERDEEKEIVSRVWEILGSPSFASLRGRSIYDLLQETISARKDAQAEIDKARKREREIYARLDLIMKFIQPRTVVPQMYREDEHD